MMKHLCESVCVISMMTNENFMINAITFKYKMIILTMIST